MSIIKKTSIALVIAGLLSSTALADGGHHHASGSTSSDTGKTEGKVAVKIRGGYVFSQHKKHSNYKQDLTINGITIPGGTINNADIKVDNGGIVEIAGGYFITDNIAIEGSIGYSLMKMSANTTTGFADLSHLGIITTPGGMKASKVIRIIPITALVQYHFLPDASFSPYVGVGYSYRFMSGGPDNVSLKDGGGIVGQVGLDIPYNDSMAFNIDVKYTHRPSANVKVKSVIKGINKDLISSTKTVKFNPSTTAVTAGVTFSF